MSKNLNLRKSGFLGVPNTSVGWWSIYLMLMFLGLFGGWIAYVWATPIARPTFYSDPLHAALLLGATVAGLGGGVVGVLAFVIGRERSLLILPSIIVGGLVLFVVIGTMAGLNT
jgi:hypothetical protein